MPVQDPLAEPILLVGGEEGKQQADAIKRTLAVPRRGSLTAIAREQLDIEDALDRVGGVGKFQFVQFFFAGMFWFLSPSILYSVFTNTPCIGARYGCEFDADDTGAPSECCSALRGPTVGVLTCGADSGVCFEAVPGVECAARACSSLSEEACDVDPAGSWTDTCWAQVDGANGEVACETLAVEAGSYEDALLACTEGGGLLGSLDLFPDCVAVCPDPAEPNDLCPPPLSPPPGPPPGITGVCPLVAPNEDYWSDCKNMACQFDLTGDRSYIRPLFDSSFFLGVPLSLFCNRDLFLSLTHPLTLLVGLRLAMGSTRCRSDLRSLRPAHCTLSFLHPQRNWRHYFSHCPWSVVVFALPSYYWCRPWWLFAHRVSYWD